MLKTILLLNPVYVTLFWAVLLNLPICNATNARKFLGKFMVFSIIIYVSHFCFFYPIKNIYKYIDVIYQFSSLMVYPMYYVYLRLLTVDIKFSIKKHIFYFIAPVVLTILYMFGVIFTDFNDYQIWLFDKSTTLTGLTYINFVFVVIRFVFIIQVILVLILSLRLLKKYSTVAEHYFSDIEDSKHRNVKLLNTSVLLTGLSSIIIALLGKYYFQNDIVLIGFASVIFSSLLFLVGYMGFKQKSTDSQFSLMLEDEEDRKNNEVNDVVQLTNDNTSNNLSEKILDLFENEKLYLNENLTILDLANMLGTNRTYISQIINQYFNQNFCSLVNNFRVEEVKRNILSNHTITNNMLAENCGFTSADTLKRVVKNQTGMSVTELKKHLLKK
ncbi:MAG: hypothetical protein BGO29_08790 [Bacteroidales bacterium 36-12]|nr:MAG: hypothetical protein BGO29_08790 [Bacteroidales bacterium 36-12]